MAKTLNESKIEKLKDYIEIVNIKTYSHDQIKIDHVQSVFERCKAFDVAYVVTRSMLKKKKTPLIESMLSLHKQCIVISPCLSTKRPPAPVDFPCQMAIAVGIKKENGEVGEDVEAEGKKTKHDKSERKETEKKARPKWQSCGCALDFLCCHQNDEFQISDSWEAAYYTTAIAALVLVKAYALGELNGSYFVPNVYFYKSTDKFFTFFKLTCCLTIIGSLI